MAVTKTLTKAIPGEKNSKVEELQDKLKEK